MSTNTDMKRYEYAFHQLIEMMHKDIHAKNKEVIEIITKKEILQKQLIELRETNDHYKKMIIEFNQLKEVLLEEEKSKKEEEENVEVLVKEILKITQEIDINKDFIINLVV